MGFMAVPWHRFLGASKRPLDEVSREHWLLQKSMCVLVSRVVPFGSTVPGLWCPGFILFYRVRQDAGACGELCLVEMVWRTLARVLWPGLAQALTDRCVCLCVCCVS
jgi:hypothetical protein